MAAPPEPSPGAAPLRWMQRRGAEKGVVSPAGLHQRRAIIIDPRARRAAERLELNT